MTRGLASACPRRHAAALLAAAALVLALTFGLGAGAAAPAGAHTAEKGIWDDTFVTTDAVLQEEILDEIANDLNATTVRLMVFWAECEPLAGAYNDERLGLVKQAAEAATAHGLKVIITFYQVPQWASDQQFWVNPPGSLDPNTYYHFYIPRLDTMTRWEAFVKHVATLMKGSVYAYEPWNEPNLRWFWYPQKWDGDASFGVDRYYTLLKRAYTAIRSADPSALVLAGNTASQGHNDSTSTAPQTWAKRLKELGALECMDAYSHHPYALPYWKGDTKVVDPPWKTPRFPEITIGLANMQTLLDIFPDTDFYLTEYGYNTKGSELFGGGRVSETRQAEYVRSAYRIADRYPQVKMLMWYLRKDVEITEKAWDQFAMYTGLRRPNGARKPSWFVYAGGNSVSLRATRRIKRGERATLRGVVKNQGEAVAKVTLVIQRRTSHGWNRVAKVRTSATGHYHVHIRLHHAAKLRVKWRGVADSRTFKVRVY